ncbi:HD-GYP domain-containing protein [Sulfuricurvum sp.]|uniref:HD-GYP domain-containing protein n=1 Tax=Sulfuricurvum sp. TaxID=2025608 RepID=UPI003BAE2E02
MQRVVQRVISYKYLPLNPSSLIEGAAIPFDCYIKRFGDYVIIIEAGTIISKNLLDKIDKNGVIYILKHDTEKLKVYREPYENGNEIILHGLHTEEMVDTVSKMSHMLSQINGLDEKLEVVYSVTSNLLEAIFNKKDEKLPLEAIQESATQLVEHVSIDVKTIHVMLNRMPTDYTTHNHSTNVAFLSVILGKALGLTKEALVEIAFAGLMHDIGKIRIDKEMLLKPGPLDEDEYELVKGHSDAGYGILLDNGITNQKILYGVRFHHEKLDGSGYPQGLRGKMISVFARILGICDVFDALTTKRTFRTNYTSFEALLLMKKEMNSQLDESYIDAFIRLLR